VQPQPFTELGRPGLRHLAVGAWGEINPSYRRYAEAVRFHVGACAVRSPQAKGKVERGIGADRAWREVGARDWTGWDELQAWTDQRVQRDAQACTCPATGTSVWDAWRAERLKLAAVPLDTLLPEPFDLAVSRTVAPDCTVAFEARRYSVPFAHLGRAVTDRMLEHELRVQRRVRTSLVLSALPTGRTLANFDFAFQPALGIGDGRVLEA